jgi:hypothetical protein
MLKNGNTTNKRIAKVVTATIHVIMHPTALSSRIISITQFTVIPTARKMKTFRLFDNIGKCSKSATIVITPKTTDVTIRIIRESEVLLIVRILKSKD